MQIQMKYNGNPDGQRVRPFVPFFYPLTHFVEEIYEKTQGIAWKKEIRIYLELL